MKTIKLEITEAECGIITNALFEYAHLWRQGDGMGMGQLTAQQRIETAKEVDQLSDKVFDQRKAQDEK